jgi:hypothetical protein
MKVQEVINTIDNIKNKYIGLWELEYYLPDLNSFVCDMDEYVTHSWENPVAVKTTIYQCEDGFVGISGCSELTLEQSVKDIPCELRACRYYPHVKVTYSIIK